VHLLVALCRWCHDQTDAPYERGRLVVTALGAGQFTFEIINLAARKTSARIEPWNFAHVGKMIRAGGDGIRARGLRGRGGEPR